MAHHNYKVNRDDDPLVIQQYRTIGPIGRGTARPGRPPPVTTHIEVGPEIVLRGYVADAMRLLIDADGGPVHVSEMCPDAPARLRQAGIRIRSDVCPDFGTGRAAVWLKLDGVRARIVREASMEDAA